MGNQYQQIVQFENLYRAYRKARLGKRHQESVADFERFLEGELLALQEELQNQTYHPGAYRSFYRTEAKRRLISAAPFRDRVGKGIPSLVTLGSAKGLDSSPLCGSE